MATTIPYGHDMAKTHIIRPWYGKSHIILLISRYIIYTPILLATLVWSPLHIQKWQPLDWIFIDSFYRFYRHQILDDYRPEFCRSYILFNVWGFMYPLDMFSTNRPTDASTDGPPEPISAPHKQPDNATSLGDFHPPSTFIAVDTIADGCIDIGF
jgi:hypothetical protein